MNINAQPIDPSKDKELEAQIFRLEKQLKRLQYDASKRRYGLVWLDAPEAFEDDTENKLPILREVSEKAIVSEDEKPTHILIEGDNYHALTCLNYTHKQKLDVIYIDPPYNTGDDGFRYRDKRVMSKFPDGTFVPKDHPFRHSYWLSFMRKRLELAKNLLKDTGVIIIHMDENEFYNLGQLCKQIFGETNDLGIIIWDKKNPKGDAKGVSVMNEYILCFAKNKTAFLELPNTLKGKKANAEKIIKKARKLFTKIGKTVIPDDIKEVIKPFNFSYEILKDFEVEYDLELINKELKAWLSRQDFSGGEKAYKLIDENGDVYRGVSMAWPNKKKAPDEYFIPLKHPITDKDCPIPNRGWRNPPTTMKALLDKDLILFGKDENKQPERKYLLKENMLQNTPSIFAYAGSDDAMFDDMGLKFDNPKPVNVSKYILTSVHPNASIVLDFFAGSGTALQAILELNAEDDGQRQCILATNNENSICDEVTYPRIDKCINGYKTRKGATVKGLGHSLKYYKTDFVGKNNILCSTDEDKIELAHQAGDLLAIAENTLSKVSENDFYQLYENNEFYTAVYFREELNKFDEFVEMVEKLDYPATVYVFSWGDDEFDDSFEHIDGIKVKSIPLPILEIYKNIYNLG